MKLNPVVVAPKSFSGTGQNERKSVRVARMKAYWQSADNAILYPVGKLLALAVGVGRILADVIASGESIEMESIQVDGKTLPLQPGFSLSLANMPNTWGCPACRSAHGSGTYPSREVSAKGLASNRFFYRPSDRSLFVISDSCWSEYVEALNAATPDRFVSPATVKAQAQAKRKGVEMLEAPKQLQTA